MKFFRNESEIDATQYIIVTYDVLSTVSLRDAMWNIAIGQSVGSPFNRSKYETDDLFEKHSCIILGEEASLDQTKGGICKLAFPLANINWDHDGISQLLCFVSGGNLDIASITRCRVINIELPPSIQKPKPTFGLSGLRRYTNCYNKPLLGGIVKPKTGMSPPQLLDMVKEMVDNGVNWIKEDEILGDPDCCRLEQRLPPIMEYLKGKGVIYCVCINADPLEALTKVSVVNKLGGNGVHINFWSGWGIYSTIRKLNLPLFCHVQSSGSRIITDKRNPYGINWEVMCKLLTFTGCDSCHIGMLLGYYPSDEEETKRIVTDFQNNDMVATLSCGLHPGNVNQITKIVGNNYLANVGSALHSHKDGTGAGVRAMRQAIDGTFGAEYEQAVKQWGNK